MKVRLNGMRMYGRLYLSGISGAVGKQRAIKKIPPYFTIEVDLDTIKPRERTREGRR